MTVLPECRPAYRRDLHVAYWMTDYGDVRLPDDIPSMLSTSWLMTKTRCKLGILLDAYLAMIEENARLAYEGGTELSEAPSWRQWLADNKAVIVCG